MLYGPLQIPGHPLPSIGKFSLLPFRLEPLLIWVSSSSDILVVMGLGKTGKIVAWLAVFLTLGLGTYVVALGLSAPPAVNLGPAINVEQGTAPASPSPSSVAPSPSPKPTPSSPAESSKPPAKPSPKPTVKPSPKPAPKPTVLPSKSAPVKPLPPSEVDDDDDYADDDDDGSDDDDD